MDKHGLKLIFATESADGRAIYDIGKAETMEGVEALCFRSQGNKNAR